MELSEMNLFEENEIAVTAESSDELLKDYAIEKKVLSIDKKHEEVPVMRLNISGKVLKEELAEYIGNTYPNENISTTGKKIEIPENLFDEICDNFRKHVFDKYPLPRYLFKDVLKRVCN